MAGLTTGSLVCLLEPPGSAEESSRSNSTSSLSARFGLSPTVTSLNILALLSSALLSVTFLVFLNASQPFVLSDLLDVPTKKIGRITGNLILADECWSLVMVLVWGSLIDTVGVRSVNTAGHVIVGIALLFFPNTGTVFPGLLFARVLFATGASSLVTCLSAAFSTLAATPPKTAPYNLPSTERTPLLQVPLSESAIQDDSSQSTPPNPAHAARFAGLLGFATGCGALLAVFFFLRLPTRIADYFPIGTGEEDTSESLRRGLRWTFYSVAVLAILEGAFVFVGLRTDKALQDESAILIEEERLPIKERLKEVMKDLPTGFVVALREKEVALAYISGFATRAQSLVVSAFIPLLISSFFRSSGLCDSHLDSFLDSNKSCRQAFILSSTLTGIIQVTSLLLSPLVGHLSSNLSKPLILSITSLLGGISFLGFAFLPGGDPRSPIVWVWALGMGISQIGGIVISLALVAKVRGEVVMKEGREVGGAISGAFSFCGGAGVLLVGKIGGSAFDVWTGWPFAIVGTVDLCAAIFAGYVWVERRGRDRMERERES